MLVPALLLNVVVAAFVLAVISLGGIILWHEHRPPHTTTVRPTVHPTSSLRPTTPTINPPTPTIHLPTPTIRPPTPTIYPTPTIFPPTPTIYPTTPTIYPPTPTIYPTRPTIYPTRPTIYPPTPTIYPPTPTIYPPTPTIYPPTPTIYPPTGPTTPPPTGPTAPPTGPVIVTDIPTIMPSTDPPTPRRICETNDCRLADEDLKRKVKRGSNLPCHDFHELSCGNLGPNSNPSKEQDIILTKDILDERYNEILENPASDDIPPVVMARDLYRNCISGKPVNSAELNDISKYHQALSQTTDSRSLLKRYFELSLDFGYLPRSLFVIDVVQNPYQKDEKIIYIRNPSPSSNFYAWPLDTTSMNITYLVDWVQRRKEFVDAKFVNILNAESDEKIVADAYNNTWKEKPMTVALPALEGEIRSIPWKDILTTLFKPTIITPNQQIYVECLACLQTLAASKVVSDKERLQGFVIRHTFADDILDTTEDGVEEWFEEQAKETGKNERFKKLFCTSKITSLFKKAMDYAYIKKYVDEKKKIPLEKLTVQLTISLKNLIYGARHLEPEAKQKYADKLDSVRFVTPFHHALNDVKEINRYYNYIKTDPISYRQTLKNTRKRLIENVASELNKNSTIPIVASRYVVGDEFVHYDGAVHSIYVSVSAMHDLIFSEDRSEFLNYGALGTLIGHKISQAISIQGSSYAKHEQRIDNIYLGGDSYSDKEIDKRAQCFINSYRQHTNVSTTKEQEVDIVLENDGVQIAYYAYLNARATLLHRKDQCLPSFTNFTDGQMFWLSYAGMTCSKDAKPTGKNDYVPPYTRVNEVSRTSFDYDHDFNCDMIPMSKCNLWLDLNKKGQKTALYYLYM